MRWGKIMQWVVISGLLIIGLNQNLLLCLAASRQKAKPAMAACACPPSACMCPPMSGCEHSHQGMPRREVKRRISACPPNSNHRQAIHPLSWSWQVPILAHHYSLAPYSAFAYFNSLAAAFVLQQYLSPPDKPPRILFV